MTIPLYSILIWVTAIIIGSLGIAIYLGSDRLSSRIFSINIGFIVLWSFTVGLMPITQDPIIENIIVKLTFYLGGLIAASFFYFSKTFPEDVRPSNRLFSFLVIIESLFLPIYLGSNLIIGLSYRISGMWGWGQFYGPLWFLFDAFFLFFWIGGIVIHSDRKRG